MDTLQTEIEEELSELESDLKIEIIGINAIGRDVDNDLMTTDVRLKWLQDDEEFQIWESWQPDYRDVYILNTKSFMTNKINLTHNDMSLEDNRNKLKEMLLEAASDDDTGLN